MTNRIQIGNKDLDVGSAKVSFKRTNPMFEEVGSYTLPFDIPRTKWNEEVLKLNDIAAFSIINTYDTTIYIGPIPIYGQLVITKVYNKYYEAHFYAGNSTFRTKVKDINLSDLDYTELIAGSISVSFTDELNAAALSSFPTYNYTCFPMLAPNYYQENPFVFNPMMNPWTYDPSDPEKYGFFSSSTRGMELLFAPSFYLCFVIRKVFDLFGYVIESDDFYNDAELRTLVIANFNTQGENDTTFREYELKFSDALPEIKISDFLTSLEKLFNITFFISDISRTVNIKKNTSIIKSVPVKKLELLSREFNVEEKLDGFELGYVFDSEDSFPTIKSIDGYSVSVTVNNYSDLGSIAASSYKNKLAKVVYEDTYYLSTILDSAADTWEWKEFSKDYFNYKSEGGEFSIESAANPILTDNDFIYKYYDGSVKEFAILPIVNNSSINNLGLQEYKTFASLRLLFYRGIVVGGGLSTNPAVVESEYPLATPDVYRAQGLSSPVRFSRSKLASANQSLEWAGDYGLYITHWKDYFYWYVNLRKSATDEYSLSFSEFFSLDFFNKYMADGVTLLIRSMEIEIDFGTDTVVAGQCEVYVS
ncbi:MAG: hypothetical protein PF450_03870 [Bacteroidales bacterium]|jgi:hypothetical protein|nr:hypothetical protein [Bacteroidales bacterium]